jgi:hypothetical protein
MSHLLNFRMADQTRSDLPLSGFEQEFDEVADWRGFQGVVFSVRFAV